MRALLISKRHGKRIRVSVPDDAMDCLIEPWVVSDVGSPVQGVIANLLVDRGESVDKGQPVAQLESGVETSEVALAETRAATQSEILARKAELKLLATTDPLTGIANRRTLMEALDTHMSQALLAGTPLSCIMTDIDFFKQVNDNYGHAVGDDVIRASAQILKR